MRLSQHTNSHIKPFLYLALIGLVSLIGLTHRSVLPRYSLHQQIPLAKGISIEQSNAAQQTVFKDRPTIDSPTLSAMTAIDTMTQARLSEAYGKLPLSFEANQGQADSQVKFLSRGSGYSLFLTPNKAVFVLSKPSVQRVGKETLTVHGAANAPVAERGAVLQMKLIGATPAPKVTGLDELSGKTNYFIGNDPKKWRTDVTNYSRVQYQDVYPGIDLVYYGNQSQLEYDFVVAPRADPKIIKLAFEGAQKIRLDTDGNLILRLMDGEIRQQKPVLYQEVDGQRVEITGRYVVTGKREVRFEIEKYDASKQLVIDPVLSYSTYLGGSHNNYAWDIGVDSTGNAYITGGTSSSNFPTGAASQTSYGGSTDAFITKLNAAGTALIYSTYLGGDRTDQAYGIAVDVSGNAYITGYTSSHNFPTTSGVFQSTINSNLTNFSSSFVTKLSVTGNALAYSTYLRGDSNLNSSDTVSSDIAVDSSGNAYITGYAGYFGFPVTANAFQDEFGGSGLFGGDAFVTKINTTGSNLIYSTYLGGRDGDRGESIAVDSSGNIYVVGSTHSLNFPTLNAFRSACASCNSNSDGFVAKLNPAASGSSSLIYSTYLGGNDIDYASDIAVDESGKAYVTGRTDSSNFPTVNPLQRTRTGATDAFIAKLDPGSSGATSLLYSTYFYGVSSDAIAIDSAGNAYVAGSTSSSDSPNFPTTSDAYQSTIRGGLDAFVAKLNGTGNTLLYSTFLGGSSYDSAHGIAVDSSGSIYVTGSTGSTNFPITNNAFQTTCRACNFPFADVFITKIGDTTPASSVTPLIFIPGIGGSSLRRDVPGFNNNVWPYAVFPDLTLDPSHTPPAIYANDVIRSMLGKEFYRPLIEMLKTKGRYNEYNVHNDPSLRTTSGCDMSQQQNQPTLFVFAYDWRLRATTNAQKLKDYIGCVQRFYPGTQVDILTHSMGGLVARRYILDNSSSHSVNKMVTIAAPWLGAPKAINALETGLFFDNAWLDWVSSNQLKRLVEFFPGVHQLIPSRAYYTLGGLPYTEYHWDADGNSRVDGTYTDYTQLVNMLDYRYSDPNKRPGTTGKIFHDYPGQDNWNISEGGVNPDPAIQYFHILGRQPAPMTISNVYTRIKTKCNWLGFNCRHVLGFDVSKTYGDGTVPEFSASRVGNGKNFNAQGVVPVRFNTTDGHTALTKNQSVHNYILSILRPAQVSTLSDFAQTESHDGQIIMSIGETVDEQAYYLNISGSASVTVADNSGHTTAPVEGTVFGGEVPGVTTDMLDAETFFIAMSTDNTYTVTLRTSAEPIAIELTKGTDTETVQAIRYLDIVLPANLTAMLKVSPQGVEILRYDQDGDGVFEMTITPTVSVSGSAAQDTEPPIISISETRQQTGTLVTLSATDSGSGVKALHYSLDGTNYQPYTTPFNVDPYRNPLIYAFADDNVANRSSLVTYKLTAPASALQLKQATNSVGEASGRVRIIVDRKGDRSGAATINYATSDDLPIQNNCQDILGMASSRCDYATSIGTLKFAAGESSKTIFIPVVDDNIADGHETFKLTLSNPTGASLGTISAATITITDNANTPGNPIDRAAFFIRQHYIDFLGREPEPQGLTGWLNIYNNCGSTVTPPCDRIEISSAFFRSEEFQNRAYFIYRFYSLVGKIPLYDEFMPDFAQVSGFLSAQQLEENKVAFITQFMTRSDFQTRYGALPDPTAYVEALLQSVGLANHPSKQAWITGLTNDSLSRAQVLRALAESGEVYQKYYTEAFVIMQYFGYLRRSADISYLNWIQTMNSTGGDYRIMINGFLNSAEYRNRFGN